ncbi:MAG: hypothetical protein JXP48_12950 [Acidobacteria bacterium]|nr:hypothetical protein [Acidobacteriota bacterium]
MTTPPPHPARARIPHLEILDDSPDAARIVQLYAGEVLAGRTRTLRLLGRKHSARILHTLLGYEVQSSYKRIQCPDLVTARYVRLFSELGFGSIHLPYDPTVTARVIPQLEAAVLNLERRVRALFSGDPKLAPYVLRRVYALLRRRIRALSA